MSKWVQVSEVDEDFRHGLRMFLLAAVVGISLATVLCLIVWQVTR